MEERVQLLQHGAIATQARRGEGKLVDTTRETAASIKEQLAELERQLASVGQGRKAGMEGRTTG